jgi:hypothetical protein
MPNRIADAADAIARIRLARRRVTRRSEIIKQSCREFVRTKHVRAYKQIEASALRILAAEDMLKEAATQD